MWQNVQLSRPDVQVNKTTVASHRYFIKTGGLHFDETYWEGNKDYALNHCIKCTNLVIRILK